MGGKEGAGVADIVVATSVLLRGQIKGHERLEGKSKRRRHTGRAVASSN